jgi:hypothetical protein
MASIAFYPIFGKPFILYLGVITLISFLVTAIFGISFYRGLLRFKWHPAMVAVSFFLAIIMTVVGVSAGNPLVGILGILTLFSFFIAAILGLSIHQRWLNAKFMWHPVVVVISFIFATMHGILGILIFG